MLDEIAESREQRAESREQRAESRDQRSEVGEQGGKSKYGDDLTNKLQDLIDNPIKREALQNKAVERIKRYYSWEDVTDKYERLFRQVTSRV